MVWNLFALLARSYGKISAIQKYITVGILYNEMNALLEHYDAYHFSALQPRLVDSTRNNILL